MKNLNLLKSKEANEYFKRNCETQDSILYYNIINLLKISKIKHKNILEIGCANGSKLNIYQKQLKPSVSYGIDLSDKAINHGIKKYKKLKLLHLSSLNINKIKIKFDLIICGYFLDQLDRNEIFKQFDLIYKKLNKNGYLIIYDFDPLFRHTNNNIHHNNLLTFKMKYENFLEESGLFKIVYKNQLRIKSNKKYKSNDVSIVLFKKIDFKESYPENI